MESGERLTSQAPSATPSSPTFSANSVASVVPKRNLSSGGTAITSCGHLFRASGDQLFNLSTVSSAFSMVSHPIFGLHAAGSGHSEFGGLGTLRAPAALSAHPHLSPFPEWWRTAEAHARAGSTFYPPLLGMQPIFSTSTQTHDNASFHAKNAGKEGRGVAEEGVNGVINGNSATTSSSVNCTSAITTPSSSVPVKSITSGGSSRKYNQDQNQLHDGKMKEKKSRKDAVESSSNSDSDSDSSSDTSSEGITSSDSDDLEEDQSIEESDDSDSETETEAQHKKTTVLMHCVTDLKTDGRKSTEKTQERTTHQQIPLLSDPQTPTAFHSQQKQTQVMSQQLPFVFQSSQVKEESVNKHTSVIQSTGLVTNVNLLGPQDKKEANLKLLTSSETTKAGNKITSEESNISTSDMRTKRDKVEQTLPVQLKKTPDVSKHQKKATLISSDSKPECSSMSLQKHSSSENSHSNPFLTNALLGKHQPNGVIHCLSQDVPLALTTSKSQCTTNESMLSSISTHFYSPLNLTCTKKMSTNVTPVVRSTSSEVQSLGKEKSVCNKITTVKTQPPLHAAKSLVDHFRRIDSDIASSKGSDESNEEEEEEEEEEDEEDDDDDDDDSDDSHSGSASNSESDTEGSDDEEDEDDDKDPEESDSDTEGEKTPLKLNKTAPSLKSSSTDPAVHSTPLNLKITNTPGSAPAALCTEFQSLAYFANSSPLTTSTPCGTDKRRRVIDQRALHIPLEYGWQRETRIRNITGRLQGEVSYFAPCGKKLRQYPEVMKYLSRNGIMDISRDNFSFSAKVRVGDFYEARDGQQGMEWCLLKEEEVVPRIRAMEGRRGRPPNPERQRTREHSRMRHRKGRPPNVSSPEFVGNNDAKMLRKIQAQEIARQAAQIKLLRKLQKQEQTRAAKEAKKQQAIMVAEEKRKQKEQIKILRQQEKIKRIQQIRVEKELRAQQILEEKELRRQQAIILKHQERERRRQHVMLMKAMDARKKTEEKERLKQEKRDEKRINKERKLELRRLELEMAKALKKPTEDMCLGDQKGMEWCLLKEEEVVPRIRAMEGRRGRPPNPERQRTREHSRMRHRKGRPPNVSSPEFVGNNDAKMLRKIQAQEIARQAAQIKLLRKLQKQEQTRAAKEAKKQQAIMVAEEKRKQKEQIKILRQQEKIKRIQQIRVEKELRAQQILEAKQKKKEEAANAKILEAEKRIKEKELRRQQAIILKHQELERHRLDMERERRRQHVMLMKAMDARKKTEEKERLKQEKRDEKRINKERKLELRRLELEMAKALKKPTEDMCLGDQKPLPDLHRIPGLILSGSTFSDCLMVVQFLRNFGKVLGFDLNTDVPNLRVLQEGLINLGSSLDEVQDLLVRLLSSAVCDPGLPSGYKAKTALGEHLINIGINRDNVSEILQIFMEAHSGQTEFTESLKTKAFQAHSPSEKASVLAFLVNELACSKCVVSEIDKSIDYMSNLRKDKWMVEGRLRKLKTIHALKTGKKDTSLGDEVGDGQHLLGTPSPGHKHGRKLGDSDYDDEDDDDDDSEDPADEDEEDEEDKDDKKGKRIDPCEDEDDDDEETASVEELEKQIEKLLKQQGQFRKKLFEASHSLRSMMFGQDRYRRRYWILPQCGGVFVEGMESGEGLEEVAKERERQKKGESIQMKEESSEISEEKLNCLHVNKWEQIQLKEKGNTNLFLQKPGSFSKLSKLLEAAKMSSESDSLIHKTNGSSTNGCTLPYHDKKNTIHNIQQSSSEISECNLFTPIASGAGKFYNCSTVPSDQLLKTLTETNRQWFNLLPRTPCDGTLVMRTDLPAMPSSMTSHSQSHSPSPIPSPNLCSISSQNPMGLSQCTLSPLQMKTGLTMMGLQLCGWPTSMLTSNLPFASPIPCLGSELELADGNGHSFVTDIIAFNKSESPLSQNESSACTPATVEVAKAVDYPSPKPIPEDMQFGWWRMSDPEELKALLKVLHLRGIREKSLQKQIQKHLEYITHACFRNKDDIIEINENEGNHITCDILKNWSVEDQAMEIDIALLQQVEDLERRVASASLQMKGWIYPEPSSEREDLVYYEHKTVSKLKMELEGQHGGEDGGNVIALERKSDNPLDIAVTRLTELERNIERRYLKSPLSTTIQIKLDNVGTVTVPAPAPSISGDGDGIEDDIAPGLRVWRKALSEARSAAQVSLCIQQLNRSIAWEKSIMKVYCQLCRKGDNEELLLLCDGCDKGCHTYCHKPKITTIPEGDWFCPACIAKASGQSPKIKKGKRSNEQKRSRSLSLTGDIEDEDPASLSSPVKKGGKDPKKRKIDENNSINLLKQESSPSSKKPKTAKDASKDLTTCSMILSEMETHQDAWPFLLPVNLKLVPGYKKVIKKPMDFSTIREKLSSGQYSNLQAFALDIRLVFNNCETFNEDDSDIGRAGHNMRIYFENKWTEMFKVS